MTPSHFSTGVYRVGFDGSTRGYAVGVGSYGQLAAGSGVTSSGSPVQILNITNFTQLSAGDYWGMGLRADGTVWVWGRNDSGQLANGYALDDGSANSHSFVPLQVAGLSNVIKVDAGFNWGMVLKADGTVWVWGNNYCGSLGQGINSGSSILTPTQVPGLTGVVDISASGGHALVLKSDGTVWSWGLNQNGELGRGSPQNGVGDGTPGQVTVLGSSVAKLFPAVSATHFVQKTDGTIWAWGQGYHGNFGNGQQGFGQLVVPTPFQVTALGTNAVLTIGAGQSITFAVMNDGTVKGFGGNYNGIELGLGSGNSVQTTPVTVPGLSNIVAVSPDWGGVALDASGRVFAWGQSGTANTYSTPTLVSGLTNITAISSGTYFFYALGNYSTTLMGIAANEDSGPQTVTSLVTSISAGPANESSQVVSFVVSNDNNALFSTQPAISTAGTLTYTLATNASGSATVTVYAQDDGGTANGGVDTSAAQTFTIAVTPVNDAPTVALASGTVTVLEDSGLQTVSGFASVTSFGPGETGQTLLGHVVTAATPSLFSVQPAISTSGVLTFTPAANANGSTTVTVVSQDSGGTANGGVDKTTNTFSITITPVNDAPSFTVPGGTVSPAMVSTMAGSSTAGGADGTGAAAQFSNPYQMAKDSAGNLYVADTGSHTVRKVTPAGVVTTLAGLAGSSGYADGTGSAARFSSPRGVAVDSSGNVYVSENNHDIRKITPAGMVTTFAGTAGNYGSADGTGGAAQFIYPTGLAFDSAGNLFVGDQGNHIIRKITSAGVVTTFAGSAGQSGSTDGTGTSARFNSPVGVAVDSADNVYVADWQNHTIRKITPAGVVTTLAGSVGNTGSTDGTGSAARFNFPFGVGVDNAGNVYVADLFNNKVRAITPAGVVTTVAGSGTSGTTDGPASTAQIQSPTSVLPDNAGNLYVTAGNALRVITPATTGPAVTVLENSGAFTANPFLTNISPGPANESDQTVTFTVTADNTGLFSTQPAISTAGTLTFTPAANASGSATVTVVAHDDGGTANGGVDTSVAQTFTIAVTAVNQPPTVAFSSGNVTVLEDSGLKTVSGFATVTSFGPGETGQTLLGHVVTAANTALFSVQPAINTSGVLTFTPAANANGTTTVTVVSQDSGGTANGGVDKTTNTFTIAVTAVNDAPSFVFDSNQLSGGGLRLQTMLSAWGFNAFGQVTVPTGLTGVTAIAVGYGHNLAVKSDGTVAAWGWNSHGQTDVPTALSSVTAVAAGQYHSLALKADGTVAAWGDGGNGATTVPSGLSGVTAIAAGGFHNLALKSDGTVVAWGSNDSGQTNVPTNLSGVTAIAAGGNHSMALKSDGTVVAWGHNGEGQTTVPNGLSEVAAIAAGWAHSLALKSNGTVVAWGWNFDGQTDVPSGLSGVMAVASGWGHSLALKSDGTVAAWGRNNVGQTDVPAGLSGVVAIGGGIYHSVALYATGSTTVPSGLTVLENSGAYTTNNFATNISAGPANESAQTVTFTVTADNTGLFSTQPAISTAGTLTFTPAANTFGSATVTVVAHDDGGTANGGVDTSAAQTFTIAVTAVNHAPTIALATTSVTVLEDSGAYSGSLATFTTGPANESGQSIMSVTVDNDNHALFSSQPAVSAGGVLTFTPALNANGSATVTVIAQDNGGTANGGVDKATNTFTITVTAVNDAPSFALPAGAPISSVFGWGYNSEYQIADGTASSKSSPVLSQFATVIQLAGGDAHSLALKADGTVWAVGNNSAGQLGDGTFTTRSTPVQVAGLTGIIQIAANFEQSFALQSDGSLWAWGYNANGELGDSTTTARSTPVQVLTGVIHVSAGRNHAVAVKSDGTVWTWGYNAYGQLGDGTTTDRHAPVQVSGLTGITKVAAGSYHSVALKSDGSLMAWGQGESGQVGTGASARYYTPVQVRNSDGTGPLTGVVAITAGNSATIALLSDATLLAWGYQTGGLGDGTSATRYLPVPVSGLANVTTIAAGFFHVLAVKTDGTLWTWGYNGSGQLGNGTTANSDVPIQVAGVSNVTVIGVGYQHSFALAAAGTGTLNVVVFENSGAYTTNTFATSISAGPANESSQTVSFTVTNNNNALFSSQPAIAANGTLTFTPAGSGYGSATVTVIAHDDGGTANGGVDTSAPQTFTITVSPLATRVFVSGATPAGRQGETLVVPILLKAAGTENAVGFTLNFDASKLTYAGVALGANATGASLLENTAPAANGRVGLVLTRGAGGGAFSAGTNELLLVSFTVSPTATVGTTPVTFTDATARREVTDASAAVIATAFVDGSVTIASAVTGTPSNYEGDVAPRPYGSGNGSVTVADSVLIGRFAAGLDTANTANGEFQRADCAPLGTKGDGRITVADWVQSLRFAAGLDTPGTVGGPTVQAAGLGTHSARLAAGGRVVRVVSSSLIAGQANTVTVQIDAQGNESGVSLSLNFDPTTLTYVSATTASGATGGSLMVNSVKAAAGKVGLVLVLPAGQSLAAGTKDLVTLTFNVTGTGSTAISVSGDSPVAREVADVTANVLGASFVDGTFNILLPAGLKAAGIERAVDGSLRLVVRNADGTAVTDVQAAKYQVYVTSNLGGAWTLLPNALVVENGALKIVDPAAKSAGVRLYKLVVTP